MKKIEPEIPSLIPKTSSWYSNNCIIIDKKPKKIVKKILKIKLILSFNKKEIIAILMVPEDVGDSTVGGKATDIDDETGTLAPGQIKPKNSGITQIEL